MDLDVALGIQPYRRLASRPFILEWRLRVDDGSAVGVAQDISDITDARVSARQIPARGDTAPSPKVWTQSNAGGCSFYTDTTDNTPVLQVTEPTGLPEGVYELLVSFETESGYTDWALQAGLELKVQP